MPGGIRRREAERSGHQAPEARKRIRGSAEDLPKSTPGIRSGAAVRRVPLIVPRFNPPRWGLSEQAVVTGYPGPTERWIVIEFRAVARRPCEESPPAGR